MSTFKTSLHICGLSQSEAADFFGVSLASVKSWGRGVRTPPRGVWEMLANLFRQVQDAAEGAADHMAAEGIDWRAWNNIEADLPHDALPNAAAMRAAGAMALLMAIADSENED